MIGGMMRKKIAIDTNILYSWCNISPNEKLPSTKLDELAEIHEFYISSSVVAEVIVKFRSDFDKLKVCLEPLHKKQIGYLNIGYIPISLEQIDFIFLEADSSKVEAEINAIFELKKVKEAEFLRFFLYSISWGIFYGLRETSAYKIENKKDDERLTLISIALLEGNQNFIYQKFKQAIDNAYDEGREDKIVKGVFCEWIVRFITFFIFNYYQAKFGLLKSVQRKTPTEESKKAVAEMKKDEFLHELNESIENPFGTLKRFLEINITQDYLDKFGLHLITDSDIPNPVIVYILKKIKKSLTEGAKISKNDIFDLLGIYPLMHDNYHYITLERQMGSFLDDIDSKSKEFLKEILQFT